MPQTLDAPDARDHCRPAGATATAVVLCIPTFRRPEGLRTLLTHIGRLQYQGPLSVIVVDNDGEYRAGAAIVNEMSRTFRFPLSCIVEPRRGQTYAYNRAFVSACRSLPAADYVAVLDDDEYPDPAWLAKMIAAALAHHAEIVGGPVLPIFEDPQHWLARGGFYQPRRFVSGRVDMIYGAGSMLIKRSVLEAYLDEPFSHDFAFTGGSDLEFFTRCRRDGHSFAWADDALVFETTPQARTNVSWLLRRNFRKGTENTRIDRRYNLGPRSLLQRWCRGIAVLAYGLLTLPFSILGGRRAMIASLNTVARGAGRIAAEFNILYEEYR
jgi:succinoglycan biosynthesis protein ExoM